MTTPVLTKALTSLRSGFNTAFPTRDKSSDGWIGDTAHQAEVSGHNPDDTAGVAAEYSDADLIAEVRAIDVDKDLNVPGVTMYDVIRRILATPADVARLRYIIFCPPSGPLGAGVPTIWSRNTGWKPVKYVGSNPHDKHAHFSGDPNTDDDARPWSVAQMGSDDVTLDDVVYTAKNADGSTYNRTVRDCLKLAELRTNYLANTLGLAARLDAILAAALDDGDVTVTADEATKAELTAIRDELAAVPQQAADLVHADLAD